jgi:hypothetical protein
MSVNVRRGRLPDGPFGAGVENWFDCALALALACGWVGGVEHAINKKANAAKVNSNCNFKFILLIMLLLSNRKTLDRIYRIYKEDQEYSCEQSCFQPASDLECVIHVRDDSLRAASPFLL